ncbi:MAG: hypothetical protein ACRESJ_15400 [Pseudomonas sp.]
MTLLRTLPDRTGTTPLTETSFGKPLNTERPPKAEMNMRTIQRSSNRYRKKAFTLVEPEAPDETAYLLSSKANAERLLKSIKRLRKSSG